METQGQKSGLGSISTLICVQMFNIEVEMCKALVQVKGFGKKLKQLKFVTIIHKPVKAFWIVQAWGFS